VDVKEPAVRRGLVGALVAALLAALLVTGSGRSASAWSLAPFDDVPEGHAFTGPIEWLQFRQLVTGYPGHAFRPSAPVLREQMAAFLHRYAGHPVVEDLPTTSPFADVPTSHVFYAEIVWLSRSGITTGYADGTFRPSDPVLREQMAAFLHRFADVREAGESIFTDVATDHVFADEIAWMADLGITTGYADGTFRPSDPTLREQMAAFLSRFDESVPAVPETAQVVLDQEPIAGATVTASLQQPHPTYTSVGFEWRDIVGPRLAVGPSFHLPAFGMTGTVHAVVRSPGHRPTWTDVVVFEADPLS